MKDNGDAWRLDLEIVVQHILDLGHSVMRNARYWTGVLMLFCPLMGLVFATYGRLLVGGVSVKGIVRHHGRPMKGVAVYLASPDRDHCSDMIAKTDAKGHFSCRPTCWDPGAIRPRYKILLYTDPRKRPAEATTDAVQGSTRRNDVAWRPSDEVSPRVGRVMLASTTSSRPEAHPSPAPSESSQSALGSRGKPMEVSLESGVVHLDIDLKD